MVPVYALQLEWKGILAVGRLGIHGHTAQPTSHKTFMGREKTRKVAASAWARSWTAGRVCIEHLGKGDGTFQGDTFLGGD